MVVGPVGTMYLERVEEGMIETNKYYVVIDSMRYEVSPQEYDALAPGQVTQLSYWPNSNTTSTVMRYSGAWPTEVVRLAKALRAGEDCAFAMRDALLDAGFPELAEHFAGETWPPWLVNMLLADAGETPQMPGP